VCLLFSCKTINTNSSNMTSPSNNTSALNFNEVNSRHQSALDTKMSKSAVAYYGDGNDVINANDKNTTVYAGEGINLVRSDKGNDTIYAGSGRDFISAGDGNNKVFAGAGDNIVITGKGKDTVFAGGGNDNISTGAGNDTIYAGAGNNLINAGTGNDTVDLTEGGSDRLILEGGQGSVTVIGFDVKVDKLRLGSSLTGKGLKFEVKGSDTVVMSGKDVLATLKGVKGGSPNLIDSGVLTRYKATDIVSGSLSSNTNGSINATSINDFGQIAGRLDTGAFFTNANATTGVVNTQNIVRQGFVWENGVITGINSQGIKKGSSDLGAANGASVTLQSPNVNTISNDGIILGTADEVRQPNPLPTDRALVWEKESGTYKLTINDLGGIESYYFDINAAGQIAGRNILTGGYEKTIVVENGVVTELAALGGDGGTARGLNEKGQIVGFVDSDGLLNDAFKNTAILWEKDAAGKYQKKNLGTFGAEQASLRDINNLGDIIGATTNGTGATLTSNPFVLRDDEFIALGSLGGKTGSTNAINDLGQVVGASQIAAGTNHAYVWSDGILSDLNNLVTAPLTYTYKNSAGVDTVAAVTLTSAVSINTFGDIVANGTYTYKDAAGKDATATCSYLLKAA
jgi:probable HAF family extracellular repeat protein